MARQLYKPNMLSLRSESSMKNFICARASRFALFANPVDAVHSSVMSAQERCGKTQVAAAARRQQGLSPVATMPHPEP